MTGTYFSLEPQSSKPPIHRLGSQAARSGQVAASGRSALSFAFDGASKFLPENEKHQLMRTALEQVYADLIGWRPEASEGNDELKNGILSHYQDTRNDPDVKMVINIVTIDPKNKSASFVDALGKLEKFISSSKTELVADTFYHLATLTNAQRGEADRICDALVDMKARGAFSYDQLNDAQQKWLGELWASRPGLQQAIKEAEDRQPTRQALLQRPDVKKEFDKVLQSGVTENGAMGHTDSSPRPAGIQRLGAAVIPAVAVDSEPPAAEPDLPPRTAASAARQALLASPKVSAIGL